MQVKRCRQCGMLKDIEAFRPYTYSKTNDTKGRLRICRECETLNSRYRLLAQKYHLDANQGCIVLPSDINVVDEFNKITRLFRLLEDKGYSTPLHTTVLPVHEESTVDRLLAFHQATLEPAPVPIGLPTSTESSIAMLEQQVPDELTYWLNTDMAEWQEKELPPEYLQETIYESLKAKYRPQIGVNHTTFIPTYDDTFKQVLNDILRKFDDYEDACNAESEE